MVLTMIGLVKFFAFSHWKPKTHVLLHIFPSKLLILGKERVIDMTWEIKEEMYSKIIKFSLLNKFIALRIHIKQEEVVSYMFISC